MQHIRSKDTKAEIKLRKALWNKGIRYRKNYKMLPGKPDIAITKHRIAVFIDGDFWHARNHQDSPGEQIGSHKEFWVKKLKRNVERDKEVNEVLTGEGWIVLRYWESDVNKNIGQCITEIISYIPEIQFDKSDFTRNGKDILKTKSN